MAKGGLIISLLFSLLFVDNALAGERVLNGKIGSTDFQVRYKNYGQQITIIRNAKEQIVKLTGYTPDSVVVQDIDGDKNDEVLFLDLFGISVGGNLRIIYWDGNAFTEVTDDDYTANRYEIRTFDGKSYVFLIQHDSMDLYYVDNILSLIDKRLVSYESKPIWNSLADYYIKKAKASKDNWEKSRYYSYAYGIFGDIGENDKAAACYRKALKLDKDNPILK